MNKLIIGLAGKAEHGKTATARIIRDRVESGSEPDCPGGTCGIFEISELIRQHCIKLGLLPEGIKREDMTYQQVAVLVSEGSRMRNEVDPQYWTTLIMQEIAKSDVDVAVIPNLRFPQEAQATRDAHGYVWRINRLNRDGSPFVSLTRDPNHETETALDRWPADFYLYNMTGHGALLEEQVITLYEYVVGLEQ